MITDPTQATETETPATETPSPERRVRRFLSQRRLVAAVALLALVGGDVFAYLGERRTLLAYAEHTEELRPSGNTDVDTESEAREMVQGSEEVLVEIREGIDSIERMFIVPFLPWHRTHREARESLLEGEHLLLKGIEIKLESWRLLAEAYEHGDYGYADSDLLNASIRRDRQAQELIARRNPHVIRFNRLISQE